MDKTGRSLGQIVTMAVFALSCFCLILFLWVTFGGPTPFKPKGYRVSVPMQEVSGLAQSADVRISGVPVGKVVKLTREGGRTEVEIEMRSRYAPLPADVRATLRRKTLLGEAYLELTPGTSAAPKLKEGATLSAARVQPSVELDEIFQSFDPKTRQAMRVWYQGWERGVKNRGRDINDAIGHLPGALESGENILDVMRAQQRATSTVVRDTGRVLATFGRQESRVDELIDAGADVFAATAARDKDLAATVHELPGFLRAMDSTLAATGRLAGPGTPVLRDLRPAARKLRPTLANAARVAPDLESLATQLDGVLDVSDKGLAAVRRTVAAVRPLLDQLWPLGRHLAPLSEWINLYRGELVNSWPKVGAATQAKAYDPATNKLIHYLRAYVYLPNEGLVMNTQRAPYSRPNAYGAPGNIRTLEKGPIEAFDCSHTSNPQTVPPLLGPAPPCLVQKPTTFRGRTGQYVRVEPAEK
jgi:virulence factor Mce-like protein